MDKNLKKESAITKIKGLYKNLPLLVKVVISISMLLVIIFVPDPLPVLDEIAMLITLIWVNTGEGKK